MMNRTTQRKLSRALVAGLGATIALGGVFWLGKMSGSAASSPSDAPQHASKRGEATETTIATKETSPADDDTGAGAGATTKPADPFADRLAQANVLTTPSAPAAPLASPLGSFSANSTTQPSSFATPTLLAADENSAVASAGDVRFAAHAGAERSAAPDSLSPAAEPLLTGNPLPTAKSLIEHGKLLDARRVLNTAITHKQLAGDADIRAAKQLLNEINAVVVFSSKPFKEDEFGGTFIVPPGGVLEKIARSHEVTVELLMRMNGISNPRSLRAAQPLKVIKGPMHAVVDKSDFTLELWIGEPEARGSMYVTSFPVGLGEHDSTPTGVWAVKNRVPNPTYYSPRGEGVIDADDPKNPLGEYWIGLTGTAGDAVGQQSYGIHGTIEPESIGKQKSMGCIRLINENVQKVFEALRQDASTVTVRE